SPAIMSWQIANEPRAFSEAGKKPFAEWLKASAAEIKRIDPNHLVSTGSEGSWGCENDLQLWADIHSDGNIDYGTIHIWPYNWGWARRESLEEDLPQACANTKEYIGGHYAHSASMGKPLVLEEFGFPRNGMAIAPGTPVSARDRYYEYVFSIIRDSGMINGANFWGWGGDARPVHRSWQPGDDYTGDPAQEDQGLNSVFSSDQSTKNMIRRLNAEIKNRTAQ
ncbi:MAG: beta-mannosidase, partial [Muribaculaceae bacterium]|nr:beta-mannosidase [Muribaculaceae bacterium]